MFADGREVLFQKLCAVESLLKTRGYRVAVNSTFAGCDDHPGKHPLYGADDRN